MKVEENMIEKSEDGHYFLVIKWILVFIGFIVCVILGCAITTNSFKTTYGDAFVPRYNVQVTINDIMDIVDDDELTEEAKIESIKDSIEVLDSEINKTD